MKLVHAFLVESYHCAANFFFRYFFTHPYHGYGVMRTLVGAYSAAYASFFQYHYFVVGQIVLVRVVMPHCLHGAVFDAGFAEFTGFLVYLGKEVGFGLCAWVVLSHDYSQYATAATAAVAGYYWFFGLVSCVMKETVIFTVFDYFQSLFLSNVPCPLILDYVVCYGVKGHTNFGIITSAVEQPTVTVENSYGSIIGNVLTNPFKGKHFGGGIQFFLYRNGSKKRIIRHSNFRRSNFMSKARIFFHNFVNLTLRIS